MAYPSASFALDSTAVTHHVTVILTTHNRRELVGRAIRSVVSQTYRNWDLLIIDDGSSDGTDTELSAYANDTRIRIIRLSPGRGGAAARNAGLDVARGDLIAFLDDDDVWRPTKLQAQVAYLDANPHVDIVSCNFLRVGDLYSREERFDGTYTAQDLEIFNVLGSFSFCMARREAIGIRRINPALQACQDWDLWLQILRNRGTDGVTLPEVLVNYDDRDKPCLSKSWRRALRSYVRFLRIYWPTFPDEIKTYHLVRVRFRRLFFCNRASIGFATRMFFWNLWPVVKSMHAVGAHRYLTLFALYLRELSRRRRGFIERR